MARIAKSEHATIQRLVEVERKKVPEIAADYGCSPANIYAILTRLRRPSPDAVNDAAPVALRIRASMVVMDDRTTPPRTYGASPAGPRPATSGRGSAARDGQKRRPTPDQATAPEAAPLLDVAEAAPMPIPAPPPLPAPIAITPPAVSPTTQTASRNASAPKARLKSGYGLCTRSPEGDDSIMPFRSLEDLLSAVKPMGPAKCAGTRYGSPFNPYGFDRDRPETL
jgi:hypothetical protein